MGKWTRDDWDSLGINTVGDRYRGMLRQEPYTESLYANYKIGSRLQGPGGLVWHYSRAGANGVVSPMWDRGMASVVVPETRAVIGATPAGSLQVVIDDANVAHLADYWANGKAEFWASVAPATFQHRMIKSSTASNGTSVTLTLYQPLTNALANGDGLEICQSVYAEVDQTSLVVAPTMASIACVPHMLITANYHFWGLTWGMCTVAVTAPLGLVASQRQICFNHNDGTIQVYADGQQHAGYLLPSTAGGAQSIIMLQLDP